MNKKSVDTATKNKLFLSFWFIIFAALILFINWIFRLPVIQSDDLNLRLANSENQITRLTALHAEFLLNYDKEDNLFAISGDNMENEAQSLIRDIKVDIKVLKDNKFVARKIMSSVDEFSATLSEFEADLTNLMLITRERGNKNSGLVLGWLELSRQMMNTYNQKDNDILLKLNQIKMLESEYLLNRSIKTLQDISISAEEIRNAITMEENGININDIDLYMVLTGNLVSIEKRMGHTDAQGIVPYLERSVKKLPAAFDTVKKVVDRQIAKIRITWTIARYVALWVIISLFIYLFIRIFSLVDPLRQISRFVKKLSDGEFPEDLIEAGKLADVKVIKESLENHVASLRDKLEFTRSLNKDVLDSSLDIQKENDLLGQELVHLQQKILETNRKQEKNDQDNLVRRYMNEGLAKFADILRSKNNDIHLLGDAFISDIVKYLNALQGGLFLYDDTDTSDPEFQLISSFAYNRKKYQQKSIKYGEGLIGTCAREKQTINLTEIPKGYITITSGLGDTPPNNLLLVPVMHDNEILGVIEIASLYNFKNHEIEFAQEVALTLGSTLINTRNNQKTSELLTKSQQQALEMAEQEEEMRQNMEELKATQEESTRREEEFRGIAEAIGKALMVIEYSLDGRIREVNESFCRFTGKEHDDIIGKFHHEVFEGSLNTDPAFWNELQQKGHLNITEIIKKGKNTIEILEHFSPVTNRNNAIVKYINFATDGRTGNR